ncbi:MAG: hypothetical protein JWP52_4164 [Rhizobacter sp.]|nr:hypothetical protein [Rhizobacter sp.]
MNSFFPHWLLSLLPSRSTVDQTERLRSCVGALLGLLATGLVSGWMLGADASAAWLIAPMGASAVLLFGVPASPLAQPWSITGGNVVSALIGVSCAKLISAPIPAAAAAVALAIAAMFALRCLHPPSGAVALTAVLGGPGVHAAGYGFVATPVALNTLLLLAAALIYNKLVGRRYPHTQQLETRHPHETADRVPTARLGFTHEDLQHVLKDYNQVLDISADDLEDLFRKTEMHAFRRRFGETRCGAIMSRDIVTVEFGTELAPAWLLMRKHGVHALPVVNRARHVIGIVTRSDFLHHADLLALPSLRARLATLLARTPHTHSDKHEVVGQIMRSPVATAQDTTPIVELVPLMADIGHHHVPIVDAQRRLVGMVTQTDLVGALYETSLAQLDEERA